MKTVGRLAMGLAVAGLANGLCAQEHQSPFARPTAKAPVEQPKTTPASPLDAMEFNGITEIGGVAWLSLYDPKTKKSYWLTKEQAAEDGISLDSYDPGSQPGEESIVVRQGNLTRRLTLKDADIITLKEAPKPAVQRASQTAAPARAQAPQRRPQNQQNIQAASDEEVRERMQRVAEEIRRRRALRNDIIDNGSNGSR